MFQFNLLGPQGGNSREMTTSPPGHCREVTVALTTAAKLQQVRTNSSEMTGQKLNEEHEILRRFMAVVVSSAFKNSLMFVDLFTRKRSFALFCALLRTCVCALLRTCVCTALRSFASFLERPHLGTPETYAIKNPGTQFDNYTIERPLVRGSEDL